ncbi:MAG: hypothetical protein JWQ87_4766 [Candidatus Sulfotelmatobacter sp.]|nr:hypothetical protein [Candidatus Sulfotelmatobacter sp.]
MEALTRSEVSWQSHAAMLETIKEHVNDLGRTMEKPMKSAMRPLSADMISSSSATVTLEQTSISWSINCNCQQMKVVVTTRCPKVCWKLSTLTVDDRKSA